MFVNGWNFLVQIYYIPSFYQLVYGYSAVKSGALLLPITLTQSKTTTITHIDPYLTLLQRSLARYQASSYTGPVGTGNVCLWVGQYGRLAWD